MSVNKRKSPPETIVIDGGSTGLAHSTTTSISVPKKIRRRIGGIQLQLTNHAPNPEREKKMDIAIADLIHSRLLPFSLAEDPKFLKILQLASRVPSSYTPPDRNAVGGVLLDTIYEANFKSSLDSLVTDGKLFGTALIGDGATMAKLPLINALGGHWE